MDFITSVYANVCGQGRCLMVDGLALPVCQRCLGLYVGAALTGVWMLGSGMWRRGLPKQRVFPLQAGVLLAAMLGGTHVIDLGPAWRVLCGLWTGHVVVLWLVGGARHLWQASLSADLAGRRWSRRDELHSVLAAALLAILAFVLPKWPVLAWHAWTAVITAGMVFLAVAVAGACVAIAAWWVYALHQASTTSVK